MAHRIKYRIMLEGGITEACSFMIATNFYRYSFNLNYEYNSFSYNFVTNSTTRYRIFSIK